MNNCVFFCWSSKLCLRFLKKKILVWIIFAGVHSDYILNPLHCLGPATIHCMMTLQSSLRKRGKYLSARPISSALSNSKGKNVTSLIAVFPLLHQLIVSHDFCYKLVLVKRKAVLLEVIQLSYLQYLWVRLNLSALFPDVKQADVHCLNI